MIFKRVDRYVGRAFLTRLVACSAVVSAMYVSFDLLKRLDDLKPHEQAGMLGLLVRDYVRLLPVLILDLLPALVLVGAGMVVVRMASRRELTLLRASGTSIHRAVLAIFLCTALVSLAALAARDTIVPRLIRERTVMADRLEGDVKHDLVLTEDLPDGARRTLCVAAYRSGSGLMENVTMLDFYPAGEGDTGRPMKQRVQADTGIIRDGLIVFEGVSAHYVYPNDTTGVPMRAAPAEGGRVALPTSLTPTQISLSALRKDEATTRGLTLKELWERMHTESHAPIYGVVFHSRLAGVFSPLILLLIGMPCLIGPGRSVNSRTLGTVLCILVAAGFYALTFTAGSLGKSETIHAALAGWLPVILGGSVGLYSFEAHMG
jgi:lipopolysaccharide export system permease protein